MGHGKHLFWCLVWVCTSLCKAQNDTIVVYDTIYEVKDPIIIIQPVDSVPQYVITQPWLSLGGGIGSQRYTGGVPVRDGRLSGLGLDIGWRYGGSHFFSTLGLQYQKASHTYELEALYARYDQNQYIRYDTLGSYLHVVDGHTQVVYVVDEIPYTKIDTVAVLHKVQRTAHIHYLSFPFVLGYSIHQNRLSMDVFMAGHPSLIVSRLEGFQGRHRKFLMLAGIGTELSFQLVKQLSIGLRYELRSSVHAAYRSEKGNSLQHFAGIRVKLFL